MDVSQLPPNLLGSLLPNQLRSLVEITAAIGRQKTRIQVLILEGPLLQKQQVPRIRTGKWLSRR